MRGYVYPSGKRRTASILLTVIAGIALGLALIFGSVSSAYAKAPAQARAPQARPPAVVVIGASHAPALKVPVAHAAGHKIA